MPPRPAQKERFRGRTVSAGSNGVRSAAVQGAHDQVIRELLDHGQRISRHRAARLSRPCLVSTRRAYCIN